ncbi:TPA: restriction endonuclease subunit S [Staphylococcus aureus]|uniref:restriction endonuclease subunit S n=2 Tax=Staphylococcus aureus TaxID=1280 RepID=UPI000D64772F|nr:restriction endonuclease subunit S [Staphylococcus aureus]MCE5083773.1 restriction endonuclease subunit S [Staphylococcus aureus]MCE5088709.1 restriction endonuclease subunit S [Staphylococcus aureus]MCE5134419.1 restriction endonuclease subunit S [Staphylococcus aureus]MCE5136952.1 restriction endonuclease subunit S [Staphylococcus aureus]MCS5344998.1 restriction endonuclease subunit S [Staphylococcus aureus]
MSNTQTKNVPELRFPGFEDEWEEKKLGEFCEFNNGINAKKEQYGMGRKFINVLDILNNNFITYENIIGKVSVPENVEKNNKVEFGDLVFLRSSETREDVGLCNVYLDKNYALYGGFIIRGKKVSDYNPIFLKEALNIPKKRYEIGSAAGGSTRFNVSQDILRKINVKFPPIKEQQKIGDLFSKLDRQIELEEQKLELLKQQKKGYMQKIFSQELRFKDENGNDYPEWENKIIKDIFIFENNRRKPITSSLREKGLYPYYGATGIIDYVKDYLFNNEERLLIGEDGAKWGQFETSSFIANGQYWVNNHAHVVKSNDHNLFFMNYYLNFKELRAFVTGNAPAKLTHANLCNINLKIPCLTEQDKVSALLKSIDNKMNNQMNRTELLKERKKGLLQKMFI